MPLSFPELDSAIAQYEGYGVAGSLATRQNNPGNLVYGPFAANRGATLGDKGFAKFPNIAAGIQAMDDLLGVYSRRGYTLDESIARWNGNGDNTPAYQEFVSQKTGKDGSDKLPGVWDDSGVPWMIGPDWLPWKIGPGLGEKVKKLGTANPFTLAGLTWTRIAAFILGLIIVTAGFFQFDSVKETTIKLVGGATKASTAAVV